MAEHPIEISQSASPKCVPVEVASSLSSEIETLALSATVPDDCIQPNNSPPVARVSAKSSEPFSEAESNALIPSVPVEQSAPRSGHLVTYVAPDIEALIKKSGESNSTSRSSSFGSPRRLVEVPPVDPRVLDDLERDTRLLADSVAHMLGSITISMHNMSAITVCSLQTCRDAVDKTCDTLDASVEVMSALLTKCEELGRLSLVINPVAKQIKDIRRMLDLFEQQLLQGSAKSS